MARCLLVLFHRPLKASKASEAAISGTFSAPLKTLKGLPADSLLCHGTSRGPTSCFCWASKLLSGTSEAPQAVSIGLRNCYLARFQHPLKASKPSKPSQQLSTAFRCFAMGPPEAPRAVSVGLRNCYLALPKRHKLFLLGFETAIWHVFSMPLKSLKTLKTLAAAFDGLSLLCHGSSRGRTSCYCWASKLLSGDFLSATSCFYWASKLLSGTFSAPLKSLKTLKTLAAAFDGLSPLCHGTSRGPTSCFCWASKLLSGTSEAPQAVSIGLRNCYLARFQHPLKPSKASKPSQQLSTAFRCFAMGPPEALQAVSVGLRNCYLALPKRHKLFLLGFETAIWHVFSMPLKSLKTLKTLAAAFDGLALLCHMLSGTFSAPLKTLKGLKTLPACSFRRPFAALPWPHELFLLGFETAISNTSEAPQAVSIGLQNCYLARFQHPLKASKPSKPSQQLSMAFRCFAMRRPEAPRAVSVGLRNCYLALPKRHKLFLLGFETAIWHVFSTP